MFEFIYKKKTKQKQQLKNWITKLQKNLNQGESLTYYT